MNEKNSLLHNVDWAIYRHRESFTLFEVACLIHLCDPGAVNDDAILGFRQMGGLAQDALLASGSIAAFMFGNPAMYFAPPVGDTLDRLKKATGLQSLGQSINRTRAKDMAETLGYQWPQPLSEPSNDVMETPAERRGRWLRMLEAEEKIHKHGALQRLADREGVDRSNMGKAIKKERQRREAETKSGGWTTQLVKGGKSTR